MTHLNVTLLDIVQDILSSLDSDEVNSINDTAEAKQVARVVRTAYYNILARANLPEHKGIFNLIGAADVDKPVLMFIPEDVSNIEWIKYNKEIDEPLEPLYDYVTILPIQQFVDMTNHFNPDDTTNVGTMAHHDVTFYYKKTQMPTYCTLIEEHEVVFDSFYNAVDTTLQTSKTMCFGQKLPLFTIGDSFELNLDDTQYPLLLNEAKSLAFYELKQSVHEKAEMESKRQWRTLQRTKHKAQVPTAFNAFADFGRSGKFSRRRWN